VKSEYRYDLEDRSIDKRL